jgi:PEP-CTERM motif
MIKRVSAQSRIFLATIAILLPATHAHASVMFLTTDSYQEFPLSGPTEHQERFEWRFSLTLAGAPFVVRQFDAPDRLTAEPSDAWWASIIVSAFDNDFTPNDFRIRAQHLKGPHHDENTGLHDVDPGVEFVFVFKGWDKLGGIESPMLLTDDFKDHLFTGQGTHQDEYRLLYNGQTLGNNGLTLSREFTLLGQHVETPEPTTLFLVGMGAVGLLRRRTRASEHTRMAGRPLSDCQ